MVSWTRVSRRSQPGNAIFLPFLLFCSLFRLSVAFENCPLLGPVFPPPSNISFGLQAAFSNLTEVLDQAIASGNSTHGLVNNKTSYSVQFFSVNEKNPLFEYYYTTPSSYGVQKVDGDSVYRIGSISKLLTVYTLLVEIGDKYWDRAVTDFIPELRALVPKSRSDPIAFNAWDEITLGSLAGQVAGVTRDLTTSGGLYKELSAQNPTQYGLPLLDSSELPPCLLNTTTMCNRTGFFEAVSTRQPTYAPNTTPIYSNTAFQILAYALESIVGQPFEELLERSLLGPLNLTGTSYTTPNADRGAIPTDPSASSWNYQMGESTPMGGIYSTANDLSTLGRSILSYALLSPNTTRGWMKPTTHTASLTGSVGRPWEIYRLALPQPDNRVTDIYTKSGSLGVYTSFLAMLPDYGIGFVTLAAGQGSYTAINGLIADIVLPELEAVARNEAESVYAATYTATNGLNSSITLTTDPSKPGLGVSSWISNGTDFLAVIAALQLVSKDESSIRIYPTDLESTSNSNASGRKIAFRGVVEVTSSFQDHGVFSSCGSWFDVDGNTWGNYPMDELIFSLSDDGTKAITVTLKFLKVNLERI
ncbi:beta-lactamase/transpeptidase-like protein [Glonium stellatum]|uniref:Beta-lactamase/transpeptidase-like protein n=1 Tax=Glonium stellatum TaxID=574774 RepID=A0A8E2EYG9_9PEZI|nr:beta-lactamase/transpeptidase-like protein [Glonium stellatum]